MRRLALALILCAAAPAALAASWSTTITGATSGDVEQSVFLPNACGTIRVGDAGAAGVSDFDSGSLVLKELVGSTWRTVKSYSAVPSVNPEEIHFKGRREAYVGVSTAASSPNLLVVITSDGLCGSL